MDKKEEDITNKMKSSRKEENVNAENAFYSLDMICQRPLQDHNWVTNYKWKLSDSQTMKSNFDLFKKLKYVIDMS